MFFTALTLGSLFSAWPQLCLGEELRHTFDTLRDDAGIVYTPDEEAQHYERFEQDLKAALKDLSIEEVKDIFDLSRPAITKSLVDEINSRQSSWVASIDQPRLHGHSRADVKSLISATPNETAVYAEAPLSSRRLAPLPKKFDARTAFKKCTKVLSYIRDQSACGSCWVMGAVGSFNGRLCVQSKGKNQKILSAGHISSCAKGGTNGCQDRAQEYAWDMLHNQGVVSGGDFKWQVDYTPADGCWPYPFFKCAHHMTSKKYKDCSKYKFTTPRCATECPNKKYPVPMDRDREFMVESSPFRFMTIDAAKNDIMTNGPISATFKVYEDFFAYKSGVYKHTTGRYIGIHQVTLLGWGVQGKEEYWLASNSWNEQWGLKGFFKIETGDSGIANEMLAGTPKL